MQGRTAVVTGAAGGIGAAIARALVSRGMRVAVNDLDPGAVEALAAQIGAIALPGDAASEHGLETLLASARSSLGRVDVFVANAGVGTLRGIEATDAEWERTLDVNLMAHVRAARILVPEWLESGGGTFVATASAAGLLMMLGDAPYSVSKHAAVAFAEWLSATYGHRGIAVHAICPQAVRTDMYHGSGPLRAVLDTAAVLDPATVAEALLAAMDEGRFLVLPHAEVADYYAFRATRTDRWLRGMQQMQQELLEGDGA